MGALHVNLNAFLLPQMTFKHCGAINNRKPHATTGGIHMVSPCPVTSLTANVSDVTGTIRKAEVHDLAKERHLRSYLSN
jgi:hypothetical protein